MSTYLLSYKQFNLHYSLCLFWPLKSILNFKDYTYTSTSCIHIAMWESCPGSPLKVKLPAELPGNHERSKWQQDLWFEISGMKDTRKKRGNTRERSRAQKKRMTKKWKRRRRKRQKSTVADGSEHCTCRQRIEPLSGATGKIASESLYSLPAALLRNPLL